MACDDGVLLLNATREPLRVLSLRRAIVLVWQGKAEIVEHTGDSVRSESYSLMKPQVIALKYFVKIPYKSSVKITNRGVLQRDGHHCAYCGKKATTVDHIIPRSKSGHHSWSNCVAACSGCNTKKAAKSLVEVGFSLDFVPGPPKQSYWELYHPAWSVYAKL